MGMLLNTGPVQFSEAKRSPNLNIPRGKALQQSCDLWLF